MSRAWHVLADLRGVEIHVDDLRLRSEGGGIAGDAVIEAEPDAEDDVGVLDGAVDVHLPVHARHAEVQRMRFGDGADAEQGGDDRDAGLLGEGPHLGVGVPEDDAVADHEQGPAGGGDELRRGPEVFAEVGGWAVGRLGDWTTAALRGTGPFHFLVLHVLRHIDEHRAGPALGGDMERLAHLCRQLGDVIHRHAVLGDGERDPDDVGFLEGVAPDHGARHLAGDRHDRRTVHLGRGDPGDEVGGARPRRRHTDARASGGARIPVRGVGRGLFVAHQDVAQGRSLRQGMVERHDRAAGIPEHQLHPLLLEQAAEDVCAGEGLAHTPQCWVEL
jgi:hypothetical protein